MKLLYNTYNLNFTNITKESLITYDVNLTVKDIIDSKIHKVIPELNEYDFVLDVYTDEDLDVESHIIHENNYYEIVFNPNYNENIERVIVHELIHLRQYLRGELIIKEDIIFWKGEEFNTKNVSYYDLPWEIEAFSEEEKY